MKKIIMMLALLSTTSAFADSYAYFNVGQESQPRPFNCTLHLETGEKVSGTVMVARGDGGAAEALSRFVSKKSTRSQDVYLTSRTKNDGSLEFFEFTTKKQGGLISEVKILNDSFCELAGQ